MGSSCFARGNAKNLRLIEDFIATNNLAACITLTGSRCEKECTEGPVVRINDTTFYNTDTGVLLDKLEQEKTAQPEL